VIELGEALPQPSHRAYPDRFPEKGDYERAKERGVEEVLGQVWEWEARCMIAATDAEDYLALLEAPLRDVALATLRRDIDTP
jgi:hypothetical protein